MIAFGLRPRKMKGMYNDVSLLHFATFVARRSHRICNTVEHDITPYFRRCPGEWRSNRTNATGVAERAHQSDFPGISWRSLRRSSRWPAALASTSCSIDVAGNPGCDAEAKCLSTTCQQQWSDLYK